MNHTDRILRDKMRRQPSGILDLPEPFTIRRRQDNPQPNLEATMEIEFEPADLAKALSKALAGNIQRQASEGVRLATGDSKALLRRECEMLMKGEPLYQLPQGVLDELEKWRVILGLSLTQLADLLRNIQLGVIAASDDPPPSQQEECQALIGRSLAASPHDRLRKNPLYRTPVHAGRFSL